MPLTGSADSGGVGCVRFVPTAFAEGEFRRTLDGHWRTSVSRTVLGRDTVITQQTRTQTPPVPNPAPTHEPRGLDRVILGVFVAVPLAAVVIGAPIALIYGWVTILDLAMLAVIYVIGVHGITIGYHRLFTHDAFKAGPRCGPPLRSRAVSPSRDGWSTGSPITASTTSSLT